MKQTLKNTRFLISLVATVEEEPGIKLSPTSSGYARLITHLKYTTVPGITTDYIMEMVEIVHDQGALAMVAIGTSRNIALQSKMTGTDIHHLGDAGYSGIAIPENIMAYSIAIRGKRHTYRRMAMSVNR